MDPGWTERPRAIEVLMIGGVIVIIALLVVPQMFGSSGSRVAPGKAELKSIRIMLENYRLDHQCYPASLKALEELEGRDPVDPWGNPFRYRLGAQKYELWSAGPDGVDGDEDDVY